MFTTDELRKFTEKFDEQLSKQCSTAWSEWKDSVLKTSEEYHLPEGLHQKLILFLNDQKHLFYRNYRQDLKNKILKSANELLDESHIKDETELFNETVLVSSPVNQGDWNSMKDQTFLNAYLKNGQIARKAAQALNIPKSTFHDWLAKNRSLIPDSQP